MPKRRGTRSSLHVAADGAWGNAAPPALPQWATRLVHWIGQVTLVAELRSIQRHLEHVLLLVRTRIDEMEAEAEEPASRQRQ